MNNKLTIWYEVEKREAVIKEVKDSIHKRDGFSDGELVSIGGGFKFLFDDETNSEIAIKFIEENGTLKVSVEGTWSWEVIEVYTHCLKQTAQENPA